MKKSPSIPDNDDDWKRESDARTLADAEAIRADPKRHKGAQTAAKKMADEQEVKAKAMRAIAQGKLSGRGKLPGPSRWK